MLSSLSILFQPFFRFRKYPEKEGDKPGDATDGQDVAPGSERKSHVIRVPSTSILLLEGLNVSTPLNAPVLVIKPDVLKPGRTYNVKLMARFRGELLNFRLVQLFVDTDIFRKWLFIMATVNVISSCFAWGEKVIKIVRGPVFHPLGPDLLSLSSCCRSGEHVRREKKARGSDEEK